MCKMAVLGRGSMRDRKKEEELRASGEAKYAHLFEDLHVEISTFAAPAEAHARIAYALAEVRRFLVPVSIPISYYLLVEKVGDWGISCWEIHNKLYIQSIRKYVTERKFIEKVERSPFSTLSH